MRDNFFSPKNLNIAPGDTVNWVNNGSNPHSATSNTDIWDSGILNHGQSFSWTFNDAGSFPYHCTVHGLMMSGTIVVGAGGGPTNDLFLVTLAGKSQTTNSFGKPIAVALKTMDIINDCAGEKMLSPSTLVLVYDLQADAVEVVERANGSTICTVATFVGGVTVPSADGKRIDRQAFVLWEDGMEPSGSIVGTELFTRGMSGELLKFSFRGSIQIGFEAYDNEPPRVFQGTFSTSRRFVPSM